MRFELQFEEGDPRGMMQRRLLPWLSDPQADPARLMDWLQGFDLPSSDEDPFIVVMRGLPFGRQGHDAEVTLAERVAALLRSQPDRHRPGRRPEALLYNLFELAAALRCPAQLALPLAAVFERRLLAGAWRALDLRVTLRAALAFNQPDARYEPIWRAMLTERTHAFLPGGPYDGFEGILMMPPAHGRAGTPAREAIGWALGQMADYLSDESYSDRRPLFRELVTRVTETYPHVEWDWELIRQAHEHGWPTWALTSLPTRLCCQIQATSGGAQGRTGCFAIWKAYSVFAQAAVREHLCDGEVLVVALSPQDAAKLHGMASVGEPTRIGCPWPTDDALTHAVKAVLRYAPGTSWTQPAQVRLLASAYALI